MLSKERESTCIYTVGHGSRALDELTHLLEHHDIACLIDVRAHPGSRRYPHFSRIDLAQSLPVRSIEYVWEGDALGGRRRPRLDSPHTALRNRSFRAYADHMQTATFKDRVRHVLERAIGSRVAIMCAERLPWQCHRFLIADYLVARGTRVLHIIDGSPVLEHRLHAVARTQGDDLIYDRETQIALDLE
ncbi:MAG TPA: DUF488 domain-containing protein [Burkholderiales bacterium]|nr:DUF488 domain-containing protein [Burkholderiales bacterium]